MERRGQRCTSVFAEMDVLARNALWPRFRFVWQPCEHHLMKLTGQLQIFMCFFVGRSRPIAGIAPLDREAAQRCYTIDRFRELAVTCGALRAQFPQVVGLSEANFSKGQ
jgi:hypothetical protein